MADKRHIAAAAILMCAIATRLIGQTSVTPAFEVASMRQNVSGNNTSYANIPLGPGNVFPATGGLLTAVNIPLYTFIAFAYKFMGNEDQVLRSQIPGWVTEEHYDLQARASGNPTKDQMRLMVRSLLAERFGLAIHRETRQLPMFALTLAKSGRMGPRLRQHPDDASCATSPLPGEEEVVGHFPANFPARCGGVLRVLPPSVAGRHSWGARNVTMSFIANQLAGMGSLDRPIADETGLTGAFDFALEWSHDPAEGGMQADDPSFLTFQEAIQEQLGLKLESKRGPAEVLVLDHIEHFAGN
jgi:uncharacterized protein (TIGR03435 family)